MCRHRFTAESLKWLRVTLVAIVAIVVIIPAGALWHLQQARSDLLALVSADGMLIDSDCHVYVPASSQPDDDDRPAAFPFGVSEFALLALLPHNSAVQVAALALLGAVATLQSQAVRWQI